jgi:hypothetical protein
METAGALHHHGSSRCRVLRQSRAWPLPVDWIQSTLGPRRNVKRPLGWDRYGNNSGGQPSSGHGWR